MIMAECGGKVGVPALPDSIITTSAKQFTPLSRDDKYVQQEGRIFLTGSQALVRLAILQAIRDKSAGWNTAGFVSGYRGSPVQSIDMEHWRARRFLEKYRIEFQPGVNEDLAATAVWGSQQVDLYPNAEVEGVFGLWYGKGPGLDRSLDAIRHANMVGTAAKGGVLAVVGDDHDLKSSDLPAACEPTFADLQMPLFFPSNTQEIIDFGLIGWALSRFSGLWVGMKLVADTVDTIGIVDADPFAVEIKIPNTYPRAPGGVNLRSPDPWVGQELRMLDYKIPMAKAFVQANQVNRLIIRAPKPRIGLVAAGKAYQDLRLAMEALAIDDEAAAAAGISLLKIGVVTPLDEDLIRSFGQGLEEIFVVEEKRAFLEPAIRNALYGLADNQRPRVTGKQDQHGHPLLSPIGELTSATVARALAQRLRPYYSSESITQKLALYEAKAQRRQQRQPMNLSRIPYFCSGCPHNRSTKLPEGARAYGGVGCHYMATYMDRKTLTHTQMGGEGSNYIGQAPFLKNDHVFQNVGDGTYFHSGSLAIRANLAANTNITFKILYNDAVAMTGGQPVDGALTPMAISQQVYAEGVRCIYVVSDDISKYPIGAGFAPDTQFAPREALDEVQRHLQEYKGVSVLIYDQTCAAELRRRRKRGRLPDPPTRMMINERVCEGCGDCSTASNCLSVLPVDTEYGRKRQIDQSSCNKDYSCSDGFCPSFVHVIGGELRRAAAKTDIPAHLQDLPEPNSPIVADDRRYNILITGIGGTGVVTIGNLISTAAFLEGMAFSCNDQHGMAQKGGAVTSHVRLAQSNDRLHAARLSTAAADLVLACDSLVTAGETALDVMNPDRTHLILNRNRAITGHFVLNQDLSFPDQAIEQGVHQEVDASRIDNVDATRLATALLGDAIGTNLFILGYAFQKGLLPVSANAVEQAIAINDVAKEMNSAAFYWGRCAAVDLNAVEAIAFPEQNNAKDSAEETVAALIERRVQDLKAYQDARYAERYRRLVEQVASYEARVMPKQSTLTEAVARNFYKLLAYKDEYEVARLYSDGIFQRHLVETFQGDFQVMAHLAPPLFSRIDPVSGRPKKHRFGPWIWRVMAILPAFKGLRGTAFDPFGYSRERRQERQLIVDYEKRIGRLLSDLRPENYDIAVSIASIPEQIRGFGPIKARSLEAANLRQQALLAKWPDGQVVLRAAAE